MTAEQLARSRPKRIVDRIALAWIVLAPFVVLAGAGLGFVDLPIPPLFAAVPEEESPDVDPQPEDPGEPGLLAPVGKNRVGSGEMLVKTSSGTAALPVLDMDVDLEVTGMIVHGTVRQTFRNITADVIEATYVFPLPERAAVHHMEMRIGPRRIVSVVKEREEAKKTYEKAKKEGKKAALVEQDRPNLFTTSAANINPGESIDVVLEYLQEVDYTDGEFSLAFPLTFTPRFVPPDPQETLDVQDVPERAHVPVVRDARRITPEFARNHAPEAPRAKITARVQVGFPLEGIECPSHDVRTWWEGDTMTVEPRNRRVLADRDFLLRWRPIVGTEPRTAPFVEDREDGRYVMLMLLPPGDDLGFGIGLPTETLFIVDVSGSMAGPFIEQAREALLAALDRLRPDDTFDILLFNDATSVFRSEFQPATDDVLSEARAWVGSLAAHGGTMIFPALQRGLAMTKASGSDRVQRMIFLTDGAVGNEDQVFGSIVANLGRVRLHTVGIGPAPNRYLMRKMAEYGRGLCGFISSVDGAENRIDSFLERLERPVMSDLALVWEGATPDEVYPSKLPDLHSGEPLFVSARLPLGATDARAVLTGLVPDREIRIETRIEANAPEGSGVAVRWARAKVGSLMDSLHGGTKEEIVRDAVVEVALAFGLVTRYTSLVAVEESPSAVGDARTARVRNALPHGSQLLGALPQGGTYEPLLLRIGLALLAAGGALLVFRKGV